MRIISKDGTEFKGISLFKTPTQHGKIEVAKPACEHLGMPYDDMGVVFKNACGATVCIGEGERLIMDLGDIKAISDYAKKSQIIASHMDTVSHLTVTRKDVRNLNLGNIIVPEDDDVLEF